MKNIRGLSALLLCAWMLMYSPAAAGDVADPSATVKSLLDAVTELSKGETVAAPGTAGRITETLDLVKICEACLRDTWKAISPTERDRFAHLFREVLEKVAYPKSAKFFKETRVEIEEVETVGNRVEVLTVVEHPEEGMIEVGYCLRLAGDRWLIDDILLDGISLVRDLRSQMQKIIREKSYDELKNRIREKLDE
ncbi:phospholipid-binding protein MlaC [Thermodesulfobacteriota bacterium]